MNIYNILVDPEMNDKVLFKAIINIPKDSIILIEDIDILFQKDTKTSLTLSGLLNVLDGACLSTEGKICILNQIIKNLESMFRINREDLIQHQWVTREK